MLQVEEAKLYCMGLFMSTLQSVFLHAVVKNASFIHSLHMV